MKNPFLRPWPAALVLAILGIVPLVAGCGDCGTGDGTASPELTEAQQKNAEYDRQTIAIMRKVLTRDGCCVDVGAYKGTILKKMVEIAPEGTHHAFEPLPAYYEGLTRKFPSPKVKVYPLALGDRTGFTTFQHVVTNPGYSGIKKRTYARPNEQIEEIRVKIDTMDHVLPPNARIDLIKIDVEGAELLVLRGARETIRRTRPVIIFEHGLGASDHYGATPGKVFALLHDDLKLNVSLMARWLKEEPPFAKAEFVDQCLQGKDFYFIAYP